MQPAASGRPDLRAPRSPPWRPGFAQIDRAQTARLQLMAAEPRRACSRWTALAPQAGALRPARRSRAAAPMLDQPVAVRPAPLALPSAKLSTRSYEILRVSQGAARAPEVSELSAAPVLAPRLQRAE